MLKLIRGFSFNSNKAGYEQDHFLYYHFYWFFSPISLDGIDYPFRSQAYLSSDNHIIVNEILDQIKFIISEQLEDIPIEWIIVEADIRGDLGADDVDMIEINFAIEEKFDINIPDDEAKLLNTVGDYYNYVKENI